MRDVRIAELTREIAAHRAAIKKAHAQRRKLKENLWRDDPEIKLLLLERDFLRQRTIEVKDLLRAAIDGSAPKVRKYRGSPTLVSRILAMLAVSQLSAHEVYINFRNQGVVTNINVVSVTLSHLVRSGRARCIEIGNISGNQRGVHYALVR